MKRLYRWLPTIVSIALVVIIMTGVMDPQMALAKYLGPGGATIGSSPPTAPPAPNLSGSGQWQQFSPSAYTWHSDPSFWKTLTHLGDVTETSAIQHLSNVVLSAMSNWMFAVIALYKSLITPDWLMVPIITEISIVFQHSVGPIFGAFLPILFIVAIGVLAYRFMQGKFRAVWIGILQMIVAIVIVGISITNFSGTFWVIDHTLNGLTDYIGTAAANAMDSGSGGMFGGVWTSFVMEPWELGQFGFWSPSTTDFNMTASAENFLARQGHQTSATNWIPYTLGSVTSVDGGAIDEPGATNDYINSQNTGYMAATGEPSSVVSAYHNGLEPPSTASEGLVVAFAASLAALPAILFLLYVGYQSFIREIFFLKTLLMGVFVLPMSFVPGRGFGQLWFWVKMALGHWMVRSGVVLYAIVVMSLGVIIGNAVGLATEKITLFSVVDGTGSTGGQGGGALFFTLILTALIYTGALLIGLPYVHRMLRSAEHKLVTSRLQMDGEISVSAEGERGAANQANAGHPQQTPVAPPETPQHHHHLVRDVAIVGGTIAAAALTGGTSLIAEGAVAVGAEAIGAEAVGAAGAEVIGAEAVGATGEAVASETAVGEVAASDASATETAGETTGGTSWIAEGVAAVGAEAIGAEAVGATGEAVASEATVGEAAASEVSATETAGETTDVSEGKSEEQSSEESRRIPQQNQANASHHAGSSLEPTQHASSEADTSTDQVMKSDTVTLLTDNLTINGLSSLTLSVPDGVATSMLNRPLAEEPARSVGESSSPDVTQGASPDVETDEEELTDQQKQSRMQRLSHWAQTRVKNTARGASNLMDKADQVANHLTLPGTKEFWDQAAKKELDKVQYSEDLPRQALHSLLLKMGVVTPTENQLSATSSLGGNLNPPNTVPARATDAKSNQADAVLKQQMADVISRLEKQQAEQQAEKEQMTEVITRLEKQQSEQLDETRKTFENLQQAQIEALKELSVKESLDMMTEALKTLGQHTDILRTIQNEPMGDADSATQSLQTLAQTIAAQVSVGLPLPPSIMAPEKPEDPNSTT